MSNFLPVVVRERVEGAPGVVDCEEFHILLNVNEITLLNKGEDPDVCFVRLTCGASLCITMSLEDFAEELDKLGVNIVDAPEPPKPKSKAKKKAVKKKK